MKIEDVKTGDSLKVTRDFVVSSVDTYEGVVYAKGGGRYRLSRGKYGLSEGPVFDFTVIKKSEPTIEHWPPQKDDVWEFGGELYHAMYDGFATYRVSLRHNSRGSFQADHIKKDGAKLVYRKGNALK